MLHENDPILQKFISVPKEMSSLNCMAFTAGNDLIWSGRSNIYILSLLSIVGMVEAVLDASGFVRS